MSTIGTASIQRVELHWPRYGAAWAHAWTATGAPAPGPATLTIADLNLVGTVTPQSGLDGPSAWSGIFVQGDGWNTVLPARPTYQNDAGVRLKNVLADLAKDCGGLAIVQPADASLGTYWTRPVLTAGGKPWTGRDELAALVRSGLVPPWWADPLDVTRFGGRTSGPVTAAARVVDRDLTRGRRMLGIDKVAPFAPGGTFEGVTIEKLIVREDDGAITCETWSTQ